MIEHVLDLGNQLKKDLETSNDFVVDSYEAVSYTHLTLPTILRV